MAVFSGTANLRRVFSRDLAVFLTENAQFSPVFSPTKRFLRLQRVRANKRTLSEDLIINKLKKMSYQSLKNKSIGLADDSGLGSDLSFSADEKKFTVWVEGNIGSGKTTLLDYYQNSDIVQALREPVDQWTNIKGHNALSLLYEDPTRWSFSFNLYAQLTRIKMHTLPHTKPIKMLERSLYSTRYCFVENNYQSKTINGLEYAVLTEWFDYLVKTKPLEIDLIVYLRADPEVCYERIKKRSRKEEAGVPLSFIEDLHNLHEEWLVKQTLGSVPAPVLVLDANIGYDKMMTLYEDKREMILFGCS